MAATSRKTLREIVEIFLACPADTDTVQAIEEALPELDAAEISTGMAMVYGLYRRALAGDHKAFVTLRDTVGELPSQQIDLRTEDALDVTVQFVPVQGTLPGVDLPQKDA